MKVSLKSKIIIIFIIIICCIGITTLIMGTLLISRGIINQVQDRVRNDLNSADEIFNNRILNIKNIIFFSTLRDSLINALINKNRPLLQKYLNEARNVGEFEILSITDKNGTVVHRSSNPGVFGDSQAQDPLIKHVIEKKTAIASVITTPPEGLKKEGKIFAERAYIKFKVTPKAKEIDQSEECCGMMIKVACPIIGKDGILLGVLYGGDLLNRNYTLVDRIKNIVYQGEKYRGKDIGSATIFQNDVRISTNVMTGKGNRAIGTRVSDEVRREVLEKGKFWIKRAFVVNDWYITAYKPITDFNGKIIGMLYVGMLENKFTDMKREAQFTLLGATIFFMLIVLIISNIFTDKIIKPINYLVDVSKKISAGDFTQKVKVESNDELGELEKAYNAMIFGLQERDMQIEKETQQKLMRSEKLAALGRMAAGIAHEINNPLTGILMYGNFLLKGLAGDKKNLKDAEIIVNETTRCRDLVRQLLDFSREYVPERKNFNINEIIEKAFSIIENQVYFEKIDFIKRLSEKMPSVMIDGNQVEQVLINLMLNAAEAMPDGGAIVVKTETDPQKKNIIITITDTGCGIPGENIDKIFDPFFTTKEVGKGTGLGLAVSYGIIRAHEGEINVKSKVNKGTTFTIALPVQSNKHEKVEVKNAT